MPGSSATLTTCCRERSRPGPGAAPGWRTPRRAPASGRDAAGRTGTATPRRSPPPLPLPPAPAGQLAAVARRPPAGRRPGTVDDMADGLMTLFLCGDVMLGRGVDQVLPHPGDPELRERSAMTHGPTSGLPNESAVRSRGRPASPGHGVTRWMCWTTLAPEARVINLETSVTRSADFMPGKPVHYRMSPANLPPWRWHGRTRARWPTTTCSTSAAPVCGTPSTRWPALGCSRSGRAVTRPRPGSWLRSRCQAVAAPWSSRAGALQRDPGRLGRDRHPARSRFPALPVRRRRRRCHRPGAGR